MPGSLSSGSSGPSPVISSRISVTKSLSSWALSASRSTITYCATSCWIWARISSSGSFSSAERLISSISRRCRRTLASRSLSVCSGLAAEAAADSGGGGGAVQDTPCSASAGASGTAGASSGAGARRAVKRPIMASSLDDLWRQLVLTSRPGQLEPAGAFLFGGGLRFRLRKNDLLERERDLVARLHVLERHAAIDRLAHDRIVIGDAGSERIAEHALDVVLAQAGGEHLLLEAVDDHLRMRPFTEPLADRLHQLLGVPQAWHGHLADDEKLIRAEQNTVGPGEPGARHVEHDIVELGRHHVEQTGHDVGIERAHLGRPIGRRDHRKAGRMVREHHLHELPVEALRSRLDLAEIEPRL